MNTSIKFVLDGKALSDNRHSVYLQVIKDRKKKNIFTGFKCLKENFDKEQFLKGHKNHRADNEVLARLKSRALQIVRDFKIEGTDFTLQDFKNKFRGLDDQNTRKIMQFFDEIIDEKKKSGKISNAKAYADTKRSFMNFAGKDITFSKLSPELMEKYEVFLRSRNNHNGGIAFKMRYLRALCNTAMKRKIMTRKYYPFEDYKIAKLKQDNNKKALTVDDFRKFRDVDLSSRPDLVDSHHYFMFSIYARGMNFVDEMKLQWTDIQNERISYKRSKTRHSFNIEINEKMAEILDYYRSKRTDSQYVFPILLKNDLTPTQIADRKQKVLLRYNRQLKEIAALANIDVPITSYVARHSFATLLKFSGTSVEKISEMMGHSNVEITNSYLKDFGNEVLDQEVNKLLNL